MNCFDILEELSNNAIKQQKNNGAMVPGHNGPYNDRETPVRNTAHWLITFYYMYKKTNNSKYLNALDRCGNYLLSNEARPMKATFFCRKEPDKDFSNGLIGQAWAIEALVAAYKATNNKDYLNTAFDVYKVHPFDSSIGLWRIVNVDGSYSKYDSTFNHQLWFAASLVLLYNECKDSILKQQLDIFFAKIQKNIRIYKNGLIKHRVYNRNILTKLIIFKEFLIRIFNNKSMIYKENGYHLFNIFAFALIKSSGYNVSFLSTKKFKKALNYSLSKAHMKGLYCNNYKSDITNLKFSLTIKPNINRYGFAYNPPGFEYPFIRIVFHNDINKERRYSIENIINKQIELTWNQNEKMFSNETEDPITLTARIYELTRYFDYYSHLGDDR